MFNHSNQEVKVEDHSYIGNVIQIVRLVIPTILILVTVSIAIVLISGYNLKEILSLIQVRTISVDLDLIFDAGNVIGMAPLSTPKMEQVSAQDINGIEVFLNNSTCDLLK